MDGHLSSTRSTHVSSGARSQLLRKLLPFHVMATVESKTQNIFTAAICLTSAVLIFAVLNAMSGMTPIRAPPQLITEHYATQQRAHVLRKALDPQPVHLKRDRVTEVPAAAPAAAQPSAAQQSLAIPAPAAAVPPNLRPQDPIAPQQYPAATAGTAVEIPAPPDKQEPVEADPQWEEVAAFTEEVAQSISKEDAAAAPVPLTSDRADAKTPDESPPSDSRFGNLTVTGLLFFGPSRMQRQRIVQCYIERNLVSNGGLLAEVIWQIQENATPQDVAFLQDILDRQPKYYRKMVLPVIPGEGHYKNHYKHIDPTKYYLKLDDDIMWVAKGAIEAMLEEKLRGRFLVVSANVINHSTLSLMHARTGALSGYVPSGLGKPWKKLEGTSFLDGSPASGMDGNVLGKCWASWQCAAVQHYNFFEHYKAGTLDRYTQFSTFDFHAQDYVRWSISFVLFKGSELGLFTHGDDEELISKDFPAAAGKHCGAVGSALVSHYSQDSRECMNVEGTVLDAEHTFLRYFTQLKGLSSQPEILAAYSVIAERTCGSLVGHR